MKNLTLSAPSPLSRIQPLRKAPGPGGSRRHLQSGVLSTLRYPLCPSRCLSTRCSQLGLGYILVSLAQTPKPGVGMASPPGGQMAPLHRSPLADGDPVHSGGGLLQSPFFAVSGTRWNPDWIWTGVAGVPTQGKREVRVSPFL